MYQKPAQKFFTGLFFLGTLFLYRCANNNLQLLNAPQGFNYTNTQGKVIASAKKNDEVQIRNIDNDIVLSFEVKDDVNLEGSVFGRNTALSFAHVANKAGITGDMTLYIPCDAEKNAVYVTPEVSEISAVSSDGEGDNVIALSEDSPGPSGGYTFINATSRSNDQDCQVLASFESFNAGAFAFTSSHAITPTSLLFLGNPFASGIGENAALALDENDVPFVAAAPYDDSDVAISVAKWDSGTAWTDLGSPGNIGSSSQIGLVIDPNDGKPMVAFADADNGSKVSIKKWSSGTTWALVGAPLSAASNKNCALAMGTDGAPVVVFKDQMAGDYVAYRYSASAWNSLGSIATSTASMPPKFKINANNQPVVVYQNSANYAQVKMWSSATTWTDLGQVSTISAAPYADIAINSNGEAYVSIQRSGFDEVSIFQWSSGTTWNQLGSNMNHYRRAPITVDKDGAPIFLRVPNSDDLQPEVLTWDGMNWVDYFDLNPIPNGSVQGFTDSSQIVLSNISQVPVVFTKGSSSLPIVYTYQ